MHRRIGERVLRSAGFADIHQSLFRRAKMVSKNTICLWYESEALEAARFYAQTFPDSAVGAVHHAPGDYPSGKQGDVLTVEFTVMGAFSRHATLSKSSESNR